MNHKGTKKTKLFNFFVPVSRWFIRMAVTSLNVSPFNT